MKDNKSYWKRPENITGTIVLAAMVFGGGLLLYRMLPVLVLLAQNTLYLAAILGALGAVLFVALDPKARQLTGYIYKSLMRWITGLFVQIDPIKVLKNYIEDLEDNLRKLSKQIGSLRGQMRQLKSTIDQNERDIQKNLSIADQARQQSDEKTTGLSARKAGRLKEANEKYLVLYRKMDTLYRVLTKMYESSEIVLEDTRDQVAIKEQEYHAIRSSYSAIRSAKSIISGDPDQRAMYDRALESMADEVSTKVGEMERFMDTSKHLLDSIDLQSGVFEEEGLKLLESWQLGQAFTTKASKDAGDTSPLDLQQPPPQPLKKEDKGYQKLFD